MKSHHVVRNLLRPLTSVLGVALGLAAWDQMAQAQTNTFNYTGSFTNWTVPAFGPYRITAFGAQSSGIDYALGGFGAKISGEFGLNSGQEITIAVGAPASLEPTSP